MANEEVKVTVEELENVYKKKYNAVDEFEWEGLILRVKHNLPLTNMMEFVSSVVQGCFDKDNGEYMPEARDFMTRYVTMLEYSNVELPSDVEQMYRLMYCTDVYMQVISHVDSVQYNQILKAIDIKIKHQLKMSESAAIKQVNEVVASMSSLGESISKLFEGIQPGDFKSVVDAVSNGVDTDSLVESVMKHRDSGVI